MRQKFYKLKELAGLYGISVQTLKRRLEPIMYEVNLIGYDDNDKPVYSDTNKILYSPKQVKLIFKYLGEPDEFPDDNVGKEKK
jgi:hypothetical protein